MEETSPKGWFKTVDHSGLWEVLFYLDKKWGQVKLGTRAVCLAFMRDSCNWMSNADPTYFQLRRYNH